MNDDNSLLPTDSESPDAPGGSSTAAEGMPWGFWATLGFAFVVFGAFLVIQNVIGIPFIFSIMAENPGIGQEKLTKLLEQNGLFLSIATIATGIVCPALIVFIAWIRRGIAL